MPTKKKGTDSYYNIVLVCVQLELSLFYFALFRSFLSPLLCCLALQEGVFTPSVFHSDISVCRVLTAGRTVALPVTLESGRALCIPKLFEAYILSWVVEY